MPVHTIGFTRLAVVLVLTSMVLGACASSRTAPMRSDAGSGSAQVKDNKPSLWTSSHPLVRKFRAQYANSSTVETALEQGKRYLPTIIREFKRQRLPEELAYLPMLESMFENRANSGHARGLWQFTPQTAEHLGLRVSAMVDERLNWRKATHAAAKYLDDLGEMFNYNWALALAAYNGGPNYVSQAVREQRTWDFWDLRLRQETQEYVPRFIAMLQVAKEKYGHMFVADLH